MPPPPTQMTFKAWKRSKLFSNATLVAGQPRLTGTLTLTLSDAAGGVPIAGAAPFTLMSAADVAGLKPNAILRTAPVAFARDAETTKFVHIDFAEVDLPWRYTPRTNTPNLRPWLAVLVGTAEELQIEANLVKMVSPAVLKDHPLSESFTWAHVQDDAHARLLSPRTLIAQHEYVAALVPAFTKTGADAWNDNATAGPLPVFYSWRFWTGEEGDFETLAAKLRALKPGAIGRAKLHYPRDVVINAATEKPIFEVRGAISSLQPDLGRIQPETMSDGQMLTALTALMPLPGNVQPKDLSLEEKRTLLLQLCQAVRDRIRETHKDLDVLTATLVDVGEPKREMISLPHYGRPWLPAPEAATAGWPEALNDDPRFRGISGLGVWMGVEGQEALMDAAVAQAGALRDAASRISHLALGVLAAGGLWERRLPEDKNARLRIFGPLMARLLAGEEGTVLSRVTSGTSPLTPAWFSSAAQRLLRDGATHSRYTLAADGAAGGLDRHALLDLANQPTPLPRRTPNGVPSLDAIAEELGLKPLETLLELDASTLEKIRAVLAALMADAARAYTQTPGAAERGALAADVAHKYASVLQDLLANFHLPCEGGQLVDQMRLHLNPNLAWPAIIEDALIDERERERVEEALIREVRRCLAQRICRELAHQPGLKDPDAFCDDLLDNLPQGPTQDQKPIDLARLHDVLDAALDPRKLDSPARRRVSATIHGLDLTRLIPPEYPIGLDFPTWELLRQYDQEWLLPGAGALEKDSVTALQTNPAFIDAYMVGINTQFMSEMRWHDLAVERTCTPLRMFWGQLNYATQKREADIQPLAEWAKAPDKDVGDLTHQTIQPADANNATGSRLVIVFRSDLFRRYPSTLVYLTLRRVIRTGPGPYDLRPAPDGAPDGSLEPEDALLQLSPILEHGEAGRPDRIHVGPTFMGRLTPDITFFCFDISPDTLDQYWVMLDEPPIELRFRSQKPGPVDIHPNPMTEDAAKFAKRALDQPTRVAISGPYLEQQGLNPNP